jgi:hypothetical protein
MSNRLIRICLLALFVELILFAGLARSQNTSKVDWSTSSLQYSFLNEMGEEEIHQIAVRNFGSETVTINITQQTWSYGFSIIGPTSLQIEPGGAKSFTFQYHWEDHPTAMADYILSDGSKQQNLRLNGRCLQFGDSIHVPPIDLGYLQPGDTICVTAKAYNHGDTTVTIDSVVYWVQSGSWLSDLPTFPLELAKGDSMSFTICYVASGSRQNFSTALVNIWHRFVGRDSSLVRTLTLFGRTVDCYRVSTDLVNFGLVPRNQQVARSFTITNTSNDPITVTETSFNSQDNNGVSVITSLPLTIPAQDSAVVELTWMANGSGQLPGYGIFKVEGCPYFYMLAYGAVADSTLDSANVFALYGDVQHTVQIQTDGESWFKTLSFINDAGHAIKILSVSLAQGYPLELHSLMPKAPVFTMLPNDLMQVEVVYPKEVERFIDTLIIVTENAIMPLKYVISNAPTAHVGSDMRSSVKLSVRPNPSSGPVSFELVGGKAISFEVYDLLGTVVYRSQDVRESWNSSNSVAGTYFIRVTGVGDDGKPFTITQRYVRK